MALYALSDLHLDEEDGSRLFRDSRQGLRLEAFLRQLREEPDAELVLLGDIFDFTSMLPPEKGLAEFGRALGFTPDPRARSTAELAGAIAKSNPRAIAALAETARSIPVTVVPGNHDWQLGGPDGRAALDAAGLGAAKLSPQVARTVAGRQLVMQHGHQLDPANATPLGKGEVMTRVMHRAVIPFLLAHGARAQVKMDVDRVASMRPAESVVPMLRRWLTERDFDRFFDAFLDLLSANGYLEPPVSWFRRLISAERVRKRIQGELKLWEHAGEVGLAALAGERALPLGAPRPEVLVLGHTHVPDWAVKDCGERNDLLYVNLGTWTDRANDALSALDTTLPVIRIAEAQDGLEVRLFDLDRDGGELQRLSARAPKRAG